MRPSPRPVMAGICAFVIAEVALGLAFPAAAWQYVRWVAGVGVVLVVVALARLQRGR